MESGSQGDKTDQRRVRKDPGRVRGRGVSGKMRLTGIIKSKYLVFAPSSWHRAPNTLGISLVVRIYFLSPRRGLCIASGWGLTTRKS